MNKIVLNYLYLMTKYLSQSDKQSNVTLDATSLGFNDSYKKCKDFNFHPTYKES